MKKKIYLLTLISFSLLLTLSFAACDTPDQNQADTSATAEAATVADTQADTQIDTQVAPSADTVAETSAPVQTEPTDQTEKGTQTETTPETTADTTTKNVNLIPDVAINRFSEYLDNENFVSGLSQGGLRDQIGKYTEGQEIAHILPAAHNYDSEFGGGLAALGELIGYQNDFYQTSSGDESKYSNFFYTHIALENLSLPYGIDFDDSLTEVFQKIGIDIHPYNGFTSDENSDTDMTLFSDSTSTLIFRNLKLTQDPVEYQLPYELVFVETTLTTGNNGRVYTITRTVRLSFADSDGTDNDKLAYFEMSVVESYKAN